MMANTVSKINTEIIVRVLRKNRNRGIYTERDDTFNKSIVTKEKEKLLTIAPANNIVINIAMPLMKASGIDSEPPRPVMGIKARYTIFAKYVK